MAVNHPHLLQHREGGVLTLTLNRPEKLNAIDNDMAAALLEALESAKTDASVKVVRLMGNGRAFCAGRDVSAAPTAKDLQLVQAVAQAIVSSPRPVVAAVHGWTVGAGLEWMLNADFVYASDNARFRLPEASLGVFVTGGIVATLPAMVGLSRAKALMLLGEDFSAPQAAGWGLVYGVTAPDALDAQSMAACQRLAALDPEVVWQFKRVLNMFHLDRFEHAVAEESRVQQMLGSRAPIPAPATDQQPR